SGRLPRGRRGRPARARRRRRLVGAAVHLRAGAQARARPGGGEPRPAGRPAHGRRRGLRPPRRPAGPGARLRRGVRHDGVPVRVRGRPVRRPGPGSRRLRRPHRRGPGKGVRSVRVLHLGFEDPAMPGAGGGSVRTHETNRRLAARGHEITVLTTRFPGCVDRIQDGVTYLHVGAGRGGNKWTRLLGYVRGLPSAARKLPADLVVEDFFAPFSSMAAPRWTGRPTIGMVQWLHVLERIGVRSHRLLVAVSQGTAERLRALNPAAQVEVIGNGVERAAFAVPACAGRDVVFVGRLEYGGKGLDLLLAAWAQVHRMVEGDLVIAGGGPDEDRVRREVERLGLAKRVRFAGWVTGEAKWRLLAGARLAVV